MKLKSETFLDFLIVFIICSYVGPFASYSGAMTIISCLLMVLLIFYMQKSLIFNRLSLSWIILSIYIIINSFFNIPRSFLYVLLFFSGIGVLKRKYKKDNMKLIIKCLEIISIILSISIIVQVYLPTLFYQFAKYWFFFSNQLEQVQLLDKISHKYTGLMYEVSFSAVILSLGIVALYAELITSNKKRCLKIVLIILLYYTIYLTGKRSFLLIIPFCLAFFFILLNLEKFNVKRLILLLIILTIILVFFDNIYTVVFSVLGNGNTNKIELSSREKYWNLAFKMFKENPIFGEGLNSFDIEFNKAGIKHGYYEFAGAHNAYIQMLAEIGIIGTVFYGYVIVKMIIIGILDMLILLNKKDFDNIYYVSFSLISIFVLIAYGVSGNVLHQPQQLFLMFTLFGFVLSVHTELVLDKKGENKC